MFLTFKWEKAQNYYWNQTSKIFQSFRFIPRNMKVDQYVRQLLHKLILGNCQTITDLVCERTFLGFMFI